MIKPKYRTHLGPYAQEQRGERDVVEAKRRIICLSDGKDTKSVAKAHNVAKKIREANIVCDSVSQELN